MHSMHVHAYTQHVGKNKPQFIKLPAFNNRAPGILVHIITKTKKVLSLHWERHKADQADNTASNLSLSDLSEK